ncbi:Arm DNA-binding domain-containing protein [Ligilactobacillus equi]
MLMATFEKYTTKHGERYKFKVYLGTDKVTGKRIETTRRGFKTKKEAQLALNSLKSRFDAGLLNKTDGIPKTFDALFQMWLKEYRKNGSTAEYREYFYKKYL